LHKNEREITMSAEEQALQDTITTTSPSSADLSTTVVASSPLPARDTPIIHVRNLKRSFGKLEAVKDISFDVYPGEIFGFLGPNGAGKSTTINMLCTLIKPTAGTALIAGYDIVQQRSQVRASIGLIFQDSSLDDRLTADENLRFHATVYGVPTTLHKKRRTELLQMVDLLDRKDTVVRSFSGGMKRRLEIARGLLHHPRILFLDEPTIGLDPQTRLHLWRYVRNLRQQEQMTMFMTTHYMDEAEYCDRIAIVDHGTIVALDTPTNLKRLVGGDVLRLKTNDNVVAAQQINEHFGIEPREDKGELLFEIAGGEEFVPRLVETISPHIASISVRRPTLDDVFIKITGHEIREEEADAKDEMRDAIRYRAWGGKR
jgi:ABC-2 type transport system ATP-binding protein